MEQKESAARQALRKKRARKRAIRLAGAAALAAALGWMAWERKKKIGKPQA